MIKAIINLLALFSCSFAFSSESSNVNFIEVDFSYTEKSVNLSGFLGTFSEELISDENIAPLKPDLMSVDDIKQLERAERFGFQPYVLLSSSWGYPGIASNFRREAPYHNITLWEETVRAVVKTFGDRVIYYVWNEPDMPIFFGMWPGNSKENFYLVFKSAHDVIREELGNSAKIAGPTFSFLESDFDGFMKYSQENHLQVDVLSFHMLYQKDKDLDAAMGRVKDLRKEYIELGNAYQNIGMKALHVNEYLRADRQNSRPASILNFIRKMEQSGVDNASRACWGDPAIPCIGSSCMVTYFVAEWFTPGTCRDGSINGLLNKNKEPRAAWWSYHFYANGALHRVHATSSNNNLTVLASNATESISVAQVLLANINKTKDTRDIRLSLLNLNTLTEIASQPKALNYQIRKIPYLKGGAITISNLETIAKGSLELSPSENVIDIDSIGAYEVLVIEFFN